MSSSSFRSGGVCSSLSMTSSRRSSRSVRSPIPSAWRSVSISKKPAGTGLSYVFAEPEQGSPLAPAVSKLPQAIDEDSTEDPLPRLRNRLASMSSIRREVAEANQGLRPSGEEQFGEVQSNTFLPDPSLSSQPPVTQTNTPLIDPQPVAVKGDPATVFAPTINITTAETTRAEGPGTPFPSHEMTTSVDTSPRKTSWFGSLSRAKGRSDIAQMTRSVAPSPEVLPNSTNNSGILPTTSAAPSHISGETIQAVEPSQDSAPAQTPSTVPVEDPVSTFVPLLPSASSPTEVIQPQPVTKRSWFSSSTPRYPESSNPTASNTPKPQTLSIQPNPARICAATEPLSSSPAPALVPFPSLPKEIPSHENQPPQKRSWFYSSNTARSEPPSPQRSTANSIPSSIDEEVPSISKLSPPATPQTAVSPGIITSPSSGGEPGTGRRRLSSLNPSTSRFTLSIPLLGRPKVPLEQAVAVVRAETTVKTQVEAIGPEKFDQTGAQPPLFATTRIAEPTPTVNIDSVDQPPNSNATPDDAQRQLPSTSTSQQAVQQSSWWSYVGWESLSPSMPTLADQGLTQSVVPPSGDGDQSGATTGTKPESESQPASSKATITNAVSKDKDAITTLDITEHPSAVSKTVLSALDMQSKVVNDGDAGTNERKPEAPASIRSVASGSVWYTPWAWYSSPSTSTLPESSSGNIVTSGTEGKPELSQAEKVKVAALARPEVDTATKEDAESASKDAKIDEKVKVATQMVGSTEGVNPVEATISTNRSGWASFFSSKSLIVKTISNDPVNDAKVDENGMEVMDIDEEPGDAATEEPLRGRDAVKAKAIGGEAKEPSKAATKNHTLSDGKTTTPPSRSSSVKPNPILATPKATKIVAPPLSVSESLKRETVISSKVPTNKKQELTVKASATKKSGSPAPSTKSGAAPPRTPVPNLILPTWADTFHTAPRNFIPPQPVSTFSKTMKFVSEVLFATDKPESGGNSLRGKNKSKGKGREQDFVHFGKELPRAWDIMQDKVLDPDVLRGCKRVVVIGIHGWFPGAVMRSVLGEPTGTSSKFVNMMVQALEEFQEQHNVKLEKITKVPLEGEGTINGRVNKLYKNLAANQEWMDDLHAADAILVATHSQGSIVSTHLLDRLIADGHIRTSRNSAATVGTTEAFPTADLSSAHTPKPQKVCCLALCGIHLGPLRYLSSSSLLQPYFQYFESDAARELFEFQSTENDVSKNYVNALRNILNHGTKMLYVASLNDQVVPIYSGLFTAASHPLILRALYIDGDAYHSSDFLSNLLVLLLRVLNSGIPDSGLTVHLSEATAGSLNGVGHSIAYDDLSTYSLAVKYLFLTNGGLEDNRDDLVLEPFNAATEQNDYEIPWSLRDIIADERVAHFFTQEIAELRDAFREWQPKTTILRDLKRKLQPIQRLPVSFPSPSSSKL